MAYPPIGHPHYLPDSVREAAAAVADLDEDEEPMSTSPAQQKYHELRSKIAEARKTMEETAKGLFTEMVAELFAENPTLMSFSWTQYTPYFNDGEPCEFGCNGAYPTVSMSMDGDVVGYDSNSGEFTVNGDEIEGVDELVRKFKDMRIDSFSKNGKQYAYDAKTNTVTVDGEKVKTYDERRKMFDGLEKKVGAFMRNFEDEDMETMFGDHVTVTVNRDGTTSTEEYNHD
jgi:hypothetical protein